MGSNSSIKSSWQLTTVPLGACRSNVSQKPDHPWLCLCPVLFHQAGETQLRHGTAGKHRCALHYQQPLLQGHSSPRLSLSSPTKSSLLPQVTHWQHRSLRKVTLAPLPWGSAGSFSYQQLCTLPWRGVTIHLAKVPQTCFLSAARDQYLHSITKSCGLGTTDYS